MTEPRSAVSYSDRLAQFHMARDLVATGIAKWRGYKQKMVDLTKFYISIEEDDYLFTEVQKWLMKSMDFDAQRSLIAEADRSYNGEDYVYDLQLLAGNDFSNSLLIEDRMIGIEITTNKPGEKKNSASGADVLDQMFGLPQSSYAGNEQAGQMGSFSLSKRIIFTAKDQYERDIVIRHLQQIAKKMTKREPSFMIATSLGGWRRMKSIMRRPLDSVVLAGDARERLVADFERFISTEERYIELGIPWHHGYLLWGPPGTGKTSVASVLAGHFNYDVYYIPLSSLDSDAKLMECVAGVESKKALVVLEDIDIAVASHERKAGEKGVTLEGLLNAIDGIITPHGLILVMTTNNKDILDPALIRPGRADFVLEVSYVDDDQLARMCMRFMGKTFDLPAVTGKVTPAQAVGIFKDSDEEFVHSKLVALILEANFSADENTVTDSVQVTSD